MIGFQDNGDGTSTVTIQYTNNSAKLRKGLENAAKRLWADGADVKDIFNEAGEFVEQLVWDELTNQEKFDALDVGLRKWLVELAKRQYSEDSARAAVEAANNDGTIEV